MNTKILTHVLCSALLFVALCGSAQTAEPAAATGDSVLLTLQGTVEIAKAGTTTWTAGQASQTLKVGDRVRTGKNSRATVRLSNLSILRVYELTTLEIQPPQQSGNNPTLDLKSGAVYFFNRDKPQTTQFRTPSASGAIRGTEFNLAVAEDGRMLLTLVDGQVDLQNELGALELKTGEQAVVEPGQAPQKAPSVDAINVIQWTLYYPGVLDIDELGLGDDLKVQIAPSLDAYRSGDLVKAVDSYPWDRESQSPEDKVYRAALSLAAGKVDQAQNLLQNLGEGRPVQLGEALKELVAAVKHQEYKRTTDRMLATEWLAGSYYHQSRGDLDLALDAARAAANKSPNFGYAHERVAELEFSFGRTDDAMVALDRSLAISPRNAQALALKGFLLAAKNKIKEARAVFDKAIETDGNLGNGWLGRGLVKIKKGDVNGGRKDLETAASLEPNRAIFRSYLGKAWSLGRPWMYSWDQTLATKELNLAKELDPNDPTAWLYSALLNQERNQVNDAIENLERSQDLNDNRRIFRSKLLLDQDRAVRGANLASIYRDAGMTEYSVREASRAVENDPANFSAHLFLSESYDALRDPKAMNLRYETPWFNELLLANLLAPVGAGNLSQNISQQEYSKLFESDKFGVSSDAEYFSSGDWRLRASQYGTLGNSSYALDVDHQAQLGQRLNNDFETTFVSAKFKQQLTPKDSILLQVTRQDFRGGDLLQYYSQGSGSVTLRTKDLQEPNLFLGYHHEWAPGNRTLVLFSRVEDSFDLTDTGALVFTLNHLSNGTLSSFPARTFSQTNHSELTGYNIEAQQMVQLSKHTLIGGARFQAADLNNSATLFRNPPLAGPLIYGSKAVIDPSTGNIVTTIAPASAQTFDSDLFRYNAYVYDYWQIVEPLQISAGVSYDYVHYPVNTDLAPISGAHSYKDQISPKIGIRYTPWKDTTFRAAYTRSLGGLFFDQSLRLEPSQLAGFTQTYRSLIPESVVGSVPGTRFSTYGAGIEQRIAATKTYLTLEGELLESDSERTVGIFDYTLTTDPTVNAVPSGTAEQFRFQERSLTFTVNQLLGDDWALGGRYRISDADLVDVFPQLPAGKISPTSSTLAPNRNISSVLQQATLFARYNHRCGFFAQPEVNWFSQSNRGYDDPRTRASENLPGDDVFQFNFFAGYRFPRRQAEIRVGVLNIFDHDYMLAPLNYYIEYPRERMLMLSAKFNF